MYARAIDLAETELHESRVTESWSAALGGATLALSILATWMLPALAIPLFIGGLFGLVSSVRAALRHSELLDDLALEQDALAIPEVRTHASRAATMGNRQDMAQSIRDIIDHPFPLALRDRVVRCAPELNALAEELERDDLALEPALAFACQRFLSDGSGPLHGAESDADELRVQIRHIRSGFAARGSERGQPLRLSPQVRRSRS